MNPQETLELRARIAELNRPVDVLKRLAHDFKGREAADIDPELFAIFLSCSTQVASQLEGLLGNGLIEFDREFQTKDEIIGQLVKSTGFKQSSVETAMIGINCIGPFTLSNPKNVRKYTIESAAEKVAVLHTRNGDYLISKIGRGVLPLRVEKL